GPDRGGADLPAHPGQFTGDAPVSPARILPCHAQDHRADRGPGGWSPRSLSLEGPPSLDEVGVPAQQRAGGDEQVPTTGRGQHSGQCAENGTIRPRWAWAGDLTP